VEENEKKLKLDQEDHFSSCQASKERESERGEYTLDQL